MNTNRNDEIGGCCWVLTMLLISGLVATAILLLLAFLSTPA